MGADSINKKDYMTDKLYKIHKKYTEGKYPEKWLELTWTHSNIILEVAMQLADNLEKNTDLKVDKDLLTQGTLLHDIGVYKCYDDEFNPNKELKPYIHHGFIGAEIIKNEGFSQSVWRFAITHTATGFTKEDIERERLPYEKLDYIPISIEEELLCYSDKFHSKHPAFDSFEKTMERINKFDPAREVKMITFKKKYGLPDMTKLILQYDQWNKDFDQWLDTI